jgi:hypothetical protein
MRDGDSAFSLHFHEIGYESLYEVYQRAQDDELLLEVTALEERIGIAWRTGGGKWASFDGRLHRQNDHLHALELEPPLDRVDDLVVQQPRDPRFVLEDQL